MREIVAQVLADEVSPVLCLNSSHGQPPPDYEFASLLGTHALCVEEARRDVAFLRSTFPKIE